MNRPLFTALACLISVSVFGQGWIQVGNDIDGYEDSYGGEVELNGQGTILAVGGSKFDNYKGIVRVYENINDEWIQLGQDILGPDGYPGNTMFGLSISLNNEGNILAIGAPSPGFGLSLGGLVQVYKYISGNWIQIGEDINSDMPVEYCGVVVDLNDTGDVIAISSRQYGYGYEASNMSEENPSNGGQGRVRVFQNINDNWLQLGASIVGQTNGALIGSDISLSGDGMRLSLSGRNPNAQNTGIIKIYDFTNNTWVQIGQDIVGEQPYSNLGTHLNLNSLGTTIAFSFTYHGDNDEVIYFARVLKYVNNQWQQIGTDVEISDVNSSLIRLKLDTTGDVLIIGLSKYIVLESLWDAGQVRIYDNTDASWVQRCDDIIGEDLGDMSGRVAISSYADYVAIGSLLNDDNGVRAGHARVYNVNRFCGCMDPVACNYNPEASEEDSSCVYSSDYYTCDQTCINDIDNDGICDELEVFGCTDSNAENYNPFSTENDENCQYIEGCTNPLAENYNPDSTLDNNTCIIVGCMDSEAFNYNSEANEEDALCLYDLDYVIDSNDDAFDDGYNDGLDSIECPPCDNDCPGDYTGDGSVTIGDLLAFLLLFGNQCE